jgi:hypothetical protein
MKVKKISVRVVILLPAINRYHLKLPAIPYKQDLRFCSDSCGESPTVKENVIYYSLANPAASNGECARCSVQPLKKDFMSLKNSPEKTIIA